MATINGFAPIDIKYPSQVLTGPALSSFFGVTPSAWSFSCLIYPRSAVDDPGINARYLVSNIASDDSGNYFVIAYTKSGVTLEMWDSSAKTITLPCSLNAWHYVQVSYNGTNLSLRIDNGAASTLACGQLSSVAGLLQIGSNWDRSAAFDGLILEIQTTSVAKTTAEFTSIGNYFEKRYGIDLGFGTGAITTHQLNDKTGGIGPDFVSQGGDLTLTPYDPKYGGQASLIPSSYANLVSSEKISLNTFTMFMVITSGVGGAYIFTQYDPVSGTYVYSWGNGGLIVAKNAGSTSISVSDSWALTPAPITIVFTYNGTAAGTSIRVNGIDTGAIASGDAGTAIMNGLMYWASDATNLYSALSGQSEFIGFNRALSTTETKRVEAYLLNKYNHYEPYIDSLALTLYHDGNGFNNVSGIWNGNISAGSVSAGNYSSPYLFPTPLLGSVLNGHSTVSFTGTQALVASQTPTVTLGTTAWSASFLVYFNSLPVDSGTVYNNPAIFADNAASTLGIAYSASGVVAFQADNGAVYNQTAAVSISINTWYSIQARWTGTSLELRVNDAAWVTVSCTSQYALNPLLFIGTNYTGGVFFNGLMEEVMMADTSFSDAVFEKIRTTAETRYNLSLVTASATSPIAATVAGVSTTTANLLGRGAIAESTAGASTTTANLLGAGAIAATSVGASTTTANLLGAGAIAATSAGASTTTANLLGAGAIAATSAGVSTTTDNLLGAGAIAATIAGASTTTANLLGAGAIAESTAGASTTTANLLGAGVIASTVAGAATIVATLDLFATVSGASTTAANLLGAGSFASTIASASTTTANLTASGDVVSTTANVSTTTANLLGDGNITSTVAGASTTTANLLGAGSFASTVAGTATVVATLDLFATVNGAATTVADLLGTGVTAATSVGTATSAANLLGAGSIAATVAGASTTASNLLGAGLIAATSISTSTTAADLLGAGNVASTIAGASTVIATASIYAIVSGVSTTTAALLGAGSIASTVASASSTVADLTAAGLLAEVGTGSTTVIANLLGTGDILSSTSGTSTTTANVLGAGSVASTVPGSATVVATLDLFATSNGVSTTAADLFATGVIASTIAGTAAASANLLATGDIASTINGVDTVAANLLAAGAMASTISGTATASATPCISSQITSVSTVIANLFGDGAMAAQIDGESIVVAANAGDILATINGESTATGTLEGYLLGNSTSSGIATIIAGILGEAPIASTIDSVSSTAANLLASGDVAAIIANVSSTSADLLANGNITATVSGNSSTSANLLASGNIASTIDGTSSTSFTADQHLNAQVSSSSTVIAALTATGVIASASHGASTVSANISFTVPSGEITATVSCAATTLGVLIGNGQMFAISNNSANVTAICEDFSGINMSMDAHVAGSSEINAFIINYLADKAIANVMKLTESGTGLGTPAIPRVIHEVVIPDIITPPPVINNPAIVKSGTKITVPIAPTLIQEISVVPEPDPEDPPSDDPAISKSGTKLGSPMIPGVIKESDNSIN